MKMEQTWRWFGPHDPVSLEDIRQTGATGIVTALHNIPPGEEWPLSAIRQRKQLVEGKGFRWSVAESIPVHENIKTRSGGYNTSVENYKQSIRNLGRLGVDTVCYNFMPALDATRTDFSHRLPDGSVALLFDATALAAFDLFLLKRDGAENQYTIPRQQKAKAYVDSLSGHQKEKLTATIVAGFPGVGPDYTLSEFRFLLDTYKEVGEPALRENLQYFLSEIIPVAEEWGVRLAIHPDDPPFPVLGLPRIVSTEKDVKQLLEVKDSPNNGFCLCTGSFGVRKDNDLAGMVRRLGHRINFVHLRNIKRLSDKRFYESDHLDGSVDMYEVMKVLLEEQQKRKITGRTDQQLPMRPDHGHQMLDDLSKETIPGYSAIGRLRGLAELRGLEVAVARSFSGSLNR